MKQSEMFLQNEFTVLESGESRTIKIKNAESDLDVSEDSAGPDKAHDSGGVGHEKGDHTDHFAFIGDEKYLSACEGSEASNLSVNEILGTIKMIK